MHFTLSLMTVKCVWMFLAGLRGVGCPLWPVSAVSVVISQETSAESAGDRGTSGESGERERDGYSRDVHPQPPHTSCNH